VTSSSKQVGGVFLVGFMGAGKTSVGRALALRLGWDFADLDDLIEQQEGRTVAEIFRDSGESAFRAAETSALLALLAQPESAAKVVALGGGAFVQRQNAQALAASGASVIFLDACIEELRHRCEPAAGRRPLFRNEEQFRKLYEARRQAYMQASVRIETTGLSIDEVVEAIVRRLEPASGAIHG
jgi:shikimate kinase